MPDQEPKDNLQWYDVRDDRFDWLNLADWEPRDGGLQPVRVPKVWHDRWPARDAASRPPA
jgi:hypothetical protein